MLRGRITGKLIFTKITLSKLITKIYSIFTSNIFKPDKIVSVRHSLGNVI